MVTSTGVLASARAASMPPKPAPAMTTFGCCAGMGPLFRLLDPRVGGRAFAHDEKDRVLVLGAVPMHLLAEMGHEGAFPHRHRVGGIELVAGADPPGALEHRDEAVVGMEMRAAEIIAGAPFVDDAVQARLWVCRGGPAIRSGRAA